jgi:hypothetical protein
MSTPDDIIGDVMDPKKVRKLREELESLRRRGGVKSGELESLAARLGRRRAVRGSEPNWVNDLSRSSRPVSIPHHGNSDLNRFTARGILNQLEEDLEKYEELLSQRQNPTN